MKWLRRKRGSRKQKGKPFPISSNKLLQVRKNPSWHSRPGYFLKDGKIQEAVFEDGKMNPVDVAVRQVGSLERSYKTPGQSCPKLTPSKLVQREELAEKIEGGKVLEAYAGEGNLSEVYAKKADEIVAIDKNEELLEKADKRLDRKVKHETIVSDNVKWLENEMQPQQLKDLKLVDFDAFGSPAEPMKAFFNNFPIKRKMFVAVTDGSKIFLGYKRPSEARRWLKANYGIDLKTQGTREDQIRILDAFMQTLGQVHKFKVKPVNVGFGKHHAVYAGYEIAPDTVNLLDM